MRIKAKGGFGRSGHNFKRWPLEPGIAEKKVWGRGGEGEEGMVRRRDGGTQERRARGNEEGVVEHWHVTGDWREGMRSFFGKA